MGRSTGTPRNTLVGIVLGCLLAAGTVPAAETLRVTGTLRTQEGAAEATVRAWAVGAWLVDHPEDRFRPLAEATVVADGSFALEVPAGALPLSVEVAAPGHVGRAILVAVPEQAELPMAWLEAGKPVTLRVRGDDGTVEGAVVWGELDGGPWDGLPGHWRRAVPRSVTAKDGTVEAVVPGSTAGVVLHALGPKGRWAAWQGRAPLPASVGLTPGGRELAVRVLAPTGEPAAGAVVMAVDAPPGTAVQTGEDGRAVLRVPPRGGWSVVAVHGDRMARSSGAELPPAGEAVELRLAAPPVVRLVLRGAPGPVLLSPAWLPPASPASLVVTREASVDLPLPAEEGGVRVWGPGLTPRMVRVAVGQEEVAVPLTGAAVVEGRVLGPGGEGVEGVWIGGRVRRWWSIMIAARGPASGRLVPLGGPMAFTGRDGRFRIAGLPAGPLELEARAAGYPPVRSGTLDLPAGGVQRVELELVPGAAVTLRVVDPEGKPLEGVQVEACPPSERDRGGASLFGTGVEGEAGCEPVAEASSGPEGRVVVAAVPVGTVDLRLSAPGFVTRLIPGVEVPPEGLELGDQELRRAVSVEGRVVDPEGRAVPGAEVMVSRNMDTPFFKATLTADQEGRFVVEGLDPTGEVYLRSRAEGWIPGPPVKVALPPEGEVEVPVRKGRALSGKVVDDESGEPLEGMRVDLMVQRTFTVPGGGEVKSWRVGGQTTTGPDGAFQVPDLEPGAVQLTVGGRGYRSSELQVTVPEDRDPEPVLLRMKPGEAVRGRVLEPDDSLAAGAQVMARVGDSGITTRTAADGSFSVEGLPPGEAHLTASTEDGKRAEATTRTGSGEEVVLRLEAPGRIVGRVLGPDGPVAEARVNGWGPSGLSMQPLRSGPDGSFVVEPASPGTWRLSAGMEGLVPARETVEVQPGEETSVELVLERGGVVEGVVRGLGPSELERCRVASGDASAVPGPDGSFRLEGVRPGRVQVRAALVPGNRSRSAVVELHDVEEPAWVELDFGGEITLSGTVTRAGLPVPGLSVVVSMVGGGDGAGTATNEGGSFEITGLGAGEYQLEVRSPSLEVLTGEHLLLDGDRHVELEIPAGGLEGRILDRETGAPVAGATVEARRQGIPPVTRSTSSDDGGRYRLGELPDGEWSVTVSAPEYRSETVPASIRDGISTRLDVELERGAGVTLLLRSPSGRTPGELFAVPLGAGVVGGDLWATCDAGGRCPLVDLPGGQWTLLVYTQEGIGLVRASCPGPEVPVDLRPAGHLRVVAAPVEGVLWRVRLSDGVTGLPLPVRRAQNPTGGEWVPVATSGLELPVPVGSWTVEAVAPDGTGETRTVEVQEGARVEVAFGGS